MKHYLLQALIIVLAVAAVLAAFVIVIAIAQYASAVFGGWAGTTFIVTVALAVLLFFIVLVQTWREGLCCTLE